MTIRIDYHTHHERCGHAVGTLEDYVRQGIRSGLAQIGLSDHMPLLHVRPEDYFPEMAMPMEELPRYVEEVLELREKYRGQIDIRLGLEGDYIEGCEEQIQAIIEAYPWDYVIGSVHFLGTWDITDFRQTAGWEGRDRLQVYETYYDAVIKAARTGFYDYIGHIDVIKRFGYAPEQDVTHLEDAALQAVADAGMAIELNASGLRMPCAEMFPGPRMLRRAHELGIPVTIGSDCHQPERLEQYLPEAREALRQAGYTQLLTFKERKRFPIPF
ncbi:Histidinol-phosphatase [Paenibacillus pasadenensis]|uniref:Histidinol-phosphatase n=1 Tax=Paenibacillus pasadenensis TaxID=217090 RepID=A0A2N5N0C9_9BACL|nr:Histidinol-phosphatase [Paenibacillus pasadenensis]